jgi:sec-independent protein translocase protein TatC
MADDSEANPDPSEAEDDEQSRTDESTPSSDADGPRDTGGTGRSEESDEVDDAPESEEADDTPDSDAESDEPDDDSETAYTPDPSVLTDVEGDRAAEDEADDDSAGEQSESDDPLSAIDEHPTVEAPGETDAPDDDSETPNDATPPQSGADSAEETVRALEEAYDLDPVEDESLVEPEASESFVADEDDADGDAEDAEDAEADPEAATDGAAPVAESGAVDADAPEVGTGDRLIDEGLVGEGPDSDREMPLADHIEEMIRRLAVVLTIGGGITLLLYPGADIANWLLGLDLLSASDVIQFLWNKHIPGAPEIADRRPRLYGPLELILTEIKVAGLAGFVLGLPVLVYESYRFMRPGLYPNERRYYLAAVPTSLVLALVGVAFAHFVVLPAIFAYFTSYTQGTAVIAFGLRETFNLILILMGYMAIVFQIPLFIMLGIMMNLFTRVWLVDKRLLFWGGFLGLAFLVSPDPTGMAPIIVAATMITLFEGTLLLLKWTGN